MGQHEYLLKTDRNYREQIATDVLLKLADLVRILAYRQGLGWNPVTGKIEGLTEDEEKLLGSIVPVVDLGEVKEASPDHQPVAGTSEKVSDAYLLTPAPTGQWDSEKVEQLEDNTPSMFAEAESGVDETAEEKPRRRRSKAAESEETSDSEG